MCHSAVAGMKGSSSRPHSASMRSSASAEVSALELHGPAHGEVKRMGGAQGSVPELLRCAWRIKPDERQHYEMSSAKLIFGIVITGHKGIMGVGGGLAPDEAVFVVDHR